MFDLQIMKEDEFIKVGVKSKDFLGNPTLNEYYITKNESGFNIAYSKVGTRYERINSSLEVNEITCVINAGGREIKLKDFIAENCNISAVTKDGELRIRLNNIIYYEVESIGASNE
ncbi:MAG: hypothetical protein ACRDA5_15995 [Clostridium sp.]